MWDYVYIPYSSHKFRRDKEIIKGTSYMKTKVHFRLYLGSYLSDLRENTSVTLHTFLIEVIELKKRQFVLSHTIRQTEIPVLLASWATNTPSVKMLCLQQNILSL
jgi:hypothetical protein